MAFVLYNDPTIQYNQSIYAYNGWNILTSTTTSSSTTSSTSTSSSSTSTSTSTSTSSSSSSSSSTSSTTTPFVSSDHEFTPELFIDEPVPETYILDDI